MAHAAALTVTQKIVLALTMVLSLSTLLGVYPLPTHYTEETRALAQYPVGPTQRTPQEIDELFRSLMHERWIAGALSGEELNAARNRGAPVLCVFRDDGRGLKKNESNGQTYWYPTVVLPTDMATQLFNTTP